MKTRLDLLNRIDELVRIADKLHCHNKQLLSACKEADAEIEMLLRCPPGAMAKRRQYLEEVKAKLWAAISAAQ